MKIVTNMQQGSADWLQFRATRFGSSEAAAMLGLSSYTTRTELLRIKHTGLDREFGDWFQRNVLDKGHAVEAATRPLIEAQIDDELYPVVCQGEGRLVASCDGMDLDGRLLWECKQWNEALAAEVRAGRVPDTHMPQCQHQLLVTGAARLLFTVSDGTGERLVSTEVLPSPEWFQRLRGGWAQFEKDLAAYVPQAAAPAAPVGKAPDTLPALRIEVQGMVTASNLAEFKQTALAAIRSVNRELKTDADFADADKAVKWCADVEARLKAAKEHALSQTASIDELFKALDDIAAESKAVRLDLGKVIDRRKVEVKEQAVAAARRALDAHVAALNAELAPMALRPVVADFAGAIKGLRSIASMQDALDTTLANGKIAADAQARLVRANVVHFHKTAVGMEFLFSDLAALVHKAPDDFELVLAGRIRKQMDLVEAQEKQRQADEAARIAAAEQRAREQEAARIADLQRQHAEAEAAHCTKCRNPEKCDELGCREKAASEPAPLLAQDECRPLSVALASKPDAPMHAREAVAAIRPAANEPATVKLGDLADTLGLTLRGDFIEQTLGIKPAGRERGAVLFQPRQVPMIVAALQRHLARVLAGLSVAA